MSSGEGDQADYDSFSGKRHLHSGDDLDLQGKERRVYAASSIWKLLLGPLMSASELLSTTGG